jgi:hypothetical protein
MAIVVDAQQEIAALAAAGDDLVILLSREGVPQEIQVKLFHIGITSIKGFAALVDSVAELRALLKKNFELDAEAHIEHRVKCANMLVAWNTARTRSV